MATRAGSSYFELYPSSDRTAGPSGAGAVGLGLGIGRGEQEGGKRKQDKVEEKAPRRRGSIASLLSSSSSRDRTRGNDQQQPTAAGRRPSIGSALLSRALGTLSNSNPRQQQPTASTSQLKLPLAPSDSATLQTPIYRSLSRTSSSDTHSSTPIGLTPPTPTQSTFTTSLLPSSSSRISRPSSSYSLDVFPTHPRPRSSRSTPSHSIHSSSPSLEQATNGLASGSSSSSYSMRNGRPISNVFPSSPRHSPSSSSLASSLRSSPSSSPPPTVASPSPLPPSSYAFPASSSLPPPVFSAHTTSPEPDIDIFVGPAPTTLSFDRRTGTYVSATAGAVPVSVREMDDLVASIGGRLSAIEARRRSSGASSGQRGRRSREPSVGSYASMEDEGPQAVMMDRDPTTTRRVERSPGRGAVEEGVGEVAPSIEDIIRAYTTDGILRPSVSSPMLSRGLSVDSESGAGQRPSKIGSSPPPPPLPPKSHIKSIDEIIRQHSFSLPVRTHKTSLPSTPTPAQALAASARSREPMYESDHSRSSTDSVGEEIYATLAHDRAKVLYHAKSFPARPPTSSSYLPALPTTPDDKADSRSLHSTYSNSTTPRQGSPSSFKPEALAIERELAHLLKSPRLTRLLTLRRSPNAGLTVSLADVGSPNGHPVLVFLGLGCVRYLIALFDDVATAFGLRLICVDRWGLGRTSEVPDGQRGFLEWASVVEEVAEQLGLERYALLAHSAGGPYALATALREPERVVGAIHLLAPWVSTSVDSLAGAFKLLRFVPSGVLRTAQAAEWKMQSWRLGKPPTIVHAPVGYDKRAGISSNDEPSSPSFALWDEGAKVDEDDFDRVSEYGSVRSGESSATVYPAGRVAVNGRPLRAKSSFLGGLFGSSKAESGEGKTMKRSASYSAASSSNGRLPLPRTSTPPSTFSRSSSSSKTPTRRSSTISSSSSGPSSYGLSSSTLPPASSSRDSSYSSPSSSPIPTPTSLSGNDLANGLLRASHAESLRGGTSDLMVILERTSKPWGFKYSDVKTPVKVWHGDKDERISLSSVRWLEKEMDECEVTVVEGADHSLMTNGRVMIEVLESIATSEWTIPP